MFQLEATHDQVLYSTAYYLTEPWDDGRTEQSLLQLATPSTAHNITAGDHNYVYLLYIDSIH